MSEPLAVIVALAALALGLCIGLSLGLFAGYRLWGPRWFDTSEGIDQKFRSIKP